MAPPRAQSRVGPTRPLLHQPPLTIENLPTRIQNGECIVLPPKFNPPICQQPQSCNPCQPPCTPCCPPYCYPCYPPCPPPMCCPPPCPVQVVCAPRCAPCTPCMPCTPCTPCMPPPPPPPCCPPPPCPPPCCQPQSCCGGGTGCCCSPRKQIVCIPRKAQQLTGGPVGTMSPCSGGGGETKSQGSKGLPGLGDQPASYNNCNFYLSDAPKSMRDKFGQARSARAEICQEEEDDECAEESDECIEDDECEEDMNFAAGDDQIVNPPVGYPGSTRTRWGGGFPGLGKGFPGTGRNCNGRSGGSGGRRNSGGGRNSVGGRNSGGSRSSRGSRAASQGDHYGKSRHGTAINGRQTAKTLGSNGSRGSYGRTGDLHSHERTGDIHSHGRTDDLHSHERTGDLHSHGRTGDLHSHGRTAGPQSSYGNYGSRDPSGTMGTHVSQGRGGMGPSGSRYTGNTGRSGNPSGRGGTVADMFRGGSLPTSRGGGGGTVGGKSKPSHLPNQSTVGKSRYRSGPSDSVISKSAGFREYPYTNDELIKKSDAYLPEMYDIPEQSSSHFVHPSRAPLSTSTKGTLPYLPSASHRSTQKSMPRSQDFGQSTAQMTQSQSTMKPSQFSMTPTNNASTQPSWTNIKSNRSTARTPPRTVTDGYSTDPYTRNQGNSEQKFPHEPRSHAPYNDTSTRDHYPSSRTAAPSQYTSNRIDDGPTQFYPSQGSRTAVSKSHTEPTLSSVLEEDSIPAYRSSTQTRLEIFDRPNQPSEIRVTQTPIQMSRSETNYRTYDSNFNPSGSNVRGTKSLDDMQDGRFNGRGFDESNYNAGISMSGQHPRGHNSGKDPRNNFKNNSGNNSRDNLGNNSRYNSGNDSPYDSQSRINMDSDFDEGGNQHGRGSNRRDDHCRPKPKTCIKYHTRRLHRLCSISNQRQRRLSQIHKPVFSIRTPECPVRETHASILRKRPPAMCGAHENRVPQFHEYCMTDHKPGTNRYPLLTREFSPLRHEFESDPNNDYSFQTRGAKRKHHHR